MPTYGQNLKVFFAPVPVPSGWAPPVITFNLSDDATPAALAAHGVKVAYLFEKLRGTLNQVNLQLGDVATAGQLSSKKLRNIEIAIGAWSVALSMQTTLMACQASNQMLTNNWFMEQSPNKPVMPTPDEQLKENMLNAFTLTAGTSILSNTVSFVSDQAVAIGTWVTKTETYKSIAKWLEDAYNTSLAPIIASAKAKLSAGLGAVGLGTPAK